MEFTGHMLSEILANEGKVHHPEDKAIDGFTY